MTKTLLMQLGWSFSVVATLIGYAASAQAQPERGTDATYIGAGISAGVTNGGQEGDAANLGGNIQGRHQIENTPVSVRGAILFGEETSAIIPMVSYDIPVAQNTNIYVGTGYSFVETEGQPSPLGNDNAVMFTVGAETQIGEKIIVYGDGKWGIDAYQNSPADALSLQGGVGYRF
ncbi:MAG: outer membrane beta-barrel protein [Spirulinaceae cyanobacterium]